MSREANALEPTDSQSVGNLPSAELGSDVGSSASAVSTDESDSAGGRFASASSPRGGAPPGAGAGPPRAAKGGSSIVHTSGITRPRTDRSAQDTEWVRQLGPLTATHRDAKARKHEEVAFRQRARLRLDGKTEAEVAQGTKWHTDRAKGHRWRIERVLDCGAEVLSVSCPCCSETIELSCGCGARLYCFHCRDRYAATRRGQFLAARADVLKEAVAARLFDVRRRGGRYGEKFLTLTVPQIWGEPVLSRIRRLLAAWPPFLKALNRHFKACAIGRVEWFKVIEWTEGKSDLHGHPHFHIWLFSPFIEAAEIRTMWSRALVTAGCPPELCLDPVFKIEQVRDSRGGVRELIKYLTKDITAGGKKIPAEVYAEVIKALDGKRATQGSKGFVGRAKKVVPACGSCGSSLPKDVRRKPKQHPTKNDVDEAGPS